MKIAKIAGTVIQVTPIEDKRISEHSPLWCSVVIKTNNGELVNAKFAASTDVDWYSLPKLKLNQTGIFDIEDGVVVWCAINQ